MLTSSRPPSGRCHCVTCIPTDMPEFKKIGDPVQKGEPLYRIHAAFDADFHFATRFAADHDGYTVVARP